MTQTERRELNAMDTVADELISNMDGYERVELAKGLYTLIEKEPEKALTVLKEAIKGAREACIEDRICPDCGSRLEFIEEEIIEEENILLGSLHCTKCRYKMRPLDNGWRWL